MGYTLLISEKPDAMRRIAEALAEGKTLKKHVDENKVAHYEFKRRGKKHVIVCAVGHLFNLNPVKKGGGWTYPIFDAEWKPSFAVRKDSLFSKKYFNVVEEMSKNASNHIVCTDFDTEGSVIAFNILKFICGAKDGKRMKFSTLTKDELIESYEKMSSHLDFGQIEAGLARHHLDWLWGINLTRALTLAMKSRMDRGYATLSTGRVQGPTLSMLLEKELKVRKFVSTPFWQLELRCKVDGTEIVAMYEKDKIWKKEDGEKVLGECKGKDATVKDAKKKKYNQKPPVPFNTTDLQSEAYAQFKYSPRQTLGIAETLYQQGFISYPRSSSQKLPPAINYEKILKALAGLKNYTALANELLGKGDLVPTEGKREDPAHPAVYPTFEPPDLKKLNAYQKKIYDLIVRRFLAVFADAAKRESVTITLDINGNKFIAIGRRTIEPGWTKFYGHYMTLEEQALPELNVGQVLKVLKIDILAKETQPPGRYSQGSILKEMEKRNLGTKATRADILRTLYDRNYVVGKSIQVTKLGETVTKVLKEFCPNILSEKLTIKFEDEMEQVMDGKKKREEIIEEAKTLLAETLKDFKKNEKKIGKKLLEGYVEARKDARLLGICPNCGNALKIIFSRKTGKRFVGCSGYPKCKTGYPLPGFGGIQKTGKVCEKCNTPIIMVFRAGKRPFKMCLDPKCPTKDGWGKS